MKALRNAWLMSFIALMVACTSQPLNLDTPTKQVAAVQASLTGIYNTIADLKINGTITAEQRDRLVKAADAVSAQLGTAKLIVAKGVPQDSLQAVILLNQALLKLQQQLQAEQGAKP